MPPELGDFIELPVEPFDREGCGRLAVGRADGEDGTAGPAGAQCHPSAHVPAVPLQRKGGLQVPVDPGGPEQSAVPAEFELVLGPAVVEARPALKGEVDGPPHGTDAADQGVPVGGGAGPVRGHEVDPLAHSVRRQESGDEDGGVRVVELLAGPVGMLGGQPHVPAAVVVEQGREDAGRIEPGSGEPVDDPLRRDERGGLQVTHQAVFGDGRVTVHCGSEVSEGIFSR